MKKLIFSFFAVSASLVSFSQVDVDKAINLTGTGSDAKVSGIDQVNSAKDAVSAEVVQKNSLAYAASTGSGSAYAISLTPAITSYTAGQVLSFGATFENAAAATLNVDGLGNMPILKNGSVALEAGDIKNGQQVTVIFDGTNFQMVSHVGNVSGGSSAGDPTLIYTTNGF